jgi:hypothetical protein
MGRVLLELVKDFAVIVIGVVAIGAFAAYLLRLL